MSSLQFGRDLMTIIFIRFPLKTYFHALFIEYLGPEWRDQTHQKTYGKKYLMVTHAKVLISHPCLKNHQISIQSCKY